MRFLELCEEPINDGTDEIVRDFVDFAGDRLGLERAPKIKLIRDPKQAAERKSFGGYMPGGGIEINIGNRHIMDVLRTLAHEMVHVRQMAKGILKSVAKGQIWNGKLFTKKTKYLDQPWEQDAFAKQELVFRRAIND